MSLSCRACRTRIEALGGCAICSELKAQLVASDEDESERPSLTDVSHEVIANLRQLNRRAKDLIADPSKPKTFAEGARLAVATGNTVAKVLESARKLQTDGLAAIQNMSFIERAELFIAWYAALPPGYREKVRAGQDKMEAQAARRLPEATS